MTNKTETKPQRELFDCLAILRANLALTQDILHEIKTHSEAMQYPELSKQNFALRKIIDKLLSDCIKKESPETQEVYNQLANDLVKALNQAAQLTFMDDTEKEKSKENAWFCVEYKDERCYAKFADGRYWLPRNPVGVREEELSVIGQMV